LNISHQLKKSEIGLTGYLSKNIDTIELLIIQDHKYENIDIIGAGAEPPNPAELLLSPRFDELINRLRTQYDYIIIDNVPCGIVADAFISNRVADLTLYVVRSGKIDRRALPDIEQLYREEKLHNMALILNGIGAGFNYYGYRYGYEYSYSYK
jgi:capsular exopolysaccharide synthesis family protein